mmetsp:Transcript_7997/g.11335  ORF Transcript_7997/g.11335 Transcript_7997/m.11335 type:complete len:295 (-) Transcript_7997:231-1115(-)|eukprot:CAMPEP_0184486446 /NCGR_PEP_ID=MMETSP0113_2-20130426/7943_1 /TAXON_ID=91329 /ORGANISM="Norrisiella sphaerica, Strain BC52" /LENGTH=294 /DNA_ID=CAMNT_0026868337 /DNA_START=126 /DNA_END=1010 /DNA_ORIENTATION=-
MRIGTSLTLLGLACYATQILQDSNRIEIVESGKAADTLFTLTTFLTLPHKLKETTKALNSIQEFALHPRIARYVVINEYDPTNDPEPMLEELRAKFPQFEFVQKSKDMRGQAKSLNMAIDMVESGKYQYWMKWEESWKADYNFLDKVYDIMDKSSLGRIGLTENPQKENFMDKEDRGDIIVWSVPKNANLTRYEFDDRMEYSRTCEAYDWPNWSLRPAFERASSILGAKFRFTEDPSAWPWPFEFEFSSKWMLNNHGEEGECGVLKKTPVSRVGGHVSTYQEDLPWSYHHYGPN